jgi:formylglycine-generating enzyme required for sulfatase activity
MLEVEGESIDGSPSAIDELEEQSCVEWADPKTRERCARFDRDSWQHAAAKLPRTRRHFCIDELEYPNEPGQYPWVMMTWREAGALCGKEKKRLCREEEWSFACEGAEGLPYPYGYNRDDVACNIDRPWRNVDEWTIGSREHPSVLKGGYWGPIRARCRPATRSHGEDFAFYQIGFRCCRDPL